MDGGSPDFPALLIRVGFFDVFISSVLLIVLNFHRLSCVGHHAFHIIIDELLDEIVEWIHGFVQQISEFSRVCS